ncbi:LacI family transcriptional regulator [Parabacteroides sp. OttesenSCG-928-N08]|nr:LacI family transcriptional regulator [Parabacteroides sp. OttesenSCG-928-N08]
MRLSLKDIAIALNVSKTTVSWVLSGRGDEKKISMAMQEKIKEYAKLHDYRPNLLAKSLNSGITNTIGLVVPSIADTFYAHIAREVELEAEKLGYTVTFCSSEANPVRESNMIQMLKAKQVDGLIIAATKHSKEEVENLMKESYPFVLIDRYFPELDTNYVIVDNENGVRCVMEKLIAHGRKKIAFVTTDVHLVVMQLRLNGYKKALEEAGMTYDPQLLLEVERSHYETDIIDKLDSLFQRVPDVDAFFFATHYLALEALRYFYERAIAFTHDVRLGCFHRSASLTILAPQMVIVDQPVSLIGKEAVDILIQSIKNNQSPITQKVLPMVLENR